MEGQAEALPPLSFALTALSITRYLEHPPRSFNLFTKTDEVRLRLRGANMISTIPQGSVLTLQQAADYLQVSKAHLSNVIAGKVAGVQPVRSFRLGRRILIKREWIDEWLELGEQQESHQ